MHILQERLKERDLKLEVSDKALDQLAEQGFDPIYGARPLKRVIGVELENPLAQAILSGTFMSGDTIIADVKEGNFTFNKK